jgi:histidine triad (HIT) family protein
MALTQEQIKELKSQLTQQISHLPEQQKAEAQKQIDEMSPETLETMIKQQKASSKNQKGVFRMIIDKEIPSREIEETKDCLAVLDIKPISKGHTVIIPKKVTGDAKSIPTSCFSLAKKISKRIEKKLKAKSAEIQTEFKFGEIIINVIPIFKESLNLNSPRTSPEDKELDEVYRTIRLIKKPKIQKIKIATKPKETKNQLQTLKRRIP